MSGQILEMYSMCLYALKQQCLSKSFSEAVHLRTSDLSHSEVRLSAFFYLDIVFFVKTFQAFERLSKRQMAEALEV